MGGGGSQHPLDEVAGGACTSSPVPSRGQVWLPSAFSGGWVSFRDSSWDVGLTPEAPRKGLGGEVATPGFQTGLTARGCRAQLNCPGAARTPEAHFLLVPLSPNPTDH